MWWIGTGAATVLASVLFTLLGVPAAPLFAGMLVGLVAALTARAPSTDPAGPEAPGPEAPGPEAGGPEVGRRALPGWLSTAGQAVVGVLCGALLSPDALATVAADWLPVLASVLATLLVSVLVGLLLGLRGDVDPITGSFALVAGGASGLTAISRELGADQRIVAVVQYLRVVIIVALMPLVATALPRGSDGAAIDAGGSPWWADVALTAGCAAAGVAVARKVPAGALLGPMVLAAVLTATGVTGAATVPAPVLLVAYATIGLEVGLSFTRASLRLVRRLLPAAVGLILLLTVVTAAVGIPLLSLTGASVLDGYLATTPGGLFAVLATAVSTGADTTLVLAVQVLRVLVMLLLAPVLATLLSRWRGS